MLLQIKTCESVLLQKILILWFDDHELTSYKFILSLLGALWELLNIRAHWNVTGYSVFGTLSYSQIMDDILGDKKLLSLYPCALFYMMVGGKWTLLVVISKENKTVSGLYSRGVNIRPTLILDGLDQSNSASVSVKKLQLQLFFYLIKKKLLWQRQKSISTTLWTYIIFFFWFGIVSICFSIMSSVADAWEHIHIKIKVRVLHGLQSQLSGYILVCSSAIS